MSAARAVIEVVLYSRSLPGVANVASSLKFVHPILQQGVEPIVYDWTVKVFCSWMVFEGFGRPMSQCTFRQPYQLKPFSRNAS